MWNQKSIGFEILVINVLRPAAMVKLLKNTGWFFSCIFRTDHAILHFLFCLCRSIMGSRPWRLTKKNNCHETFFCDCRYQATYRGQLLLIWGYSKITIEMVHIRFMTYIYFIFWSKHNCLELQAFEAEGWASIMKPLDQANCIDFVWAFFWFWFASCKIVSR